MYFRVRFSSLSLSLSMIFPLLPDVLSHCFCAAASSINEPAAFPRASMILGKIVQLETRSVVSLVNPKSERQPQVIKLLVQKKWQ
jgi:hypothetical protein